MAIPETAFSSTGFLSSAAFTPFSAAGKDFFRPDFSGSEGDRPELFWLAHAPFIFDLIAAARPGLLVDLDADGVASEAASQKIFDQAARAAAAPTTILSGAEAEAHARVLGAINGLNLGRVASLAEAEERWALWRPRLAAGALALVPGWAERDGLSEFLARRQAEGRCCAFRHHQGLGVIALGAAPEALAALFTPVAEDFAVMDRIYDRLGQGLCDARDRGEAQRLAARVSELEALLRRLDVALAHVKQGAQQASADGRLDLALARCDALAARLGVAEAALRRPPPAPAAPQSDRLNALDLRLTKAERRITRLNWHAGVLMPLTGPIVLVTRLAARKLKKFYRARRPRR